ncbi:heat shock 70 kDa protein 18-like [Lolium rigidum]|uniref:heat shock 70 kDa protein 18-like n=1 Tax=Lolium rigidum TaxID=89674 RepID=UPI001F5C7516|nr:heat shock 70 kDa protein 18-like [Lolium rigidum]
MGVNPDDEFRVLAKAEDRVAIGIDLGMTYSCVGVWRSGRVEIVANDQGNRRTPSCVAFTDSDRIIGEGASYQMARNASNTIFDVNRLIGQSFSDASVKSATRYWPFVVTGGPDGRPRIKVSYLKREKEFSPEEISAMVLAKMKETAEVYLGPGTTITDAVITVPAYFNKSQSKATKDAAEITGLNVMCIINEPTAAAMAYNRGRKWGDAKESIVLVYGLGDGTLDVSLVVVNKGVFQVKASAGDTHLGGEDFTRNMLDYFICEFKSKNQKDISGDRMAVQRLRKCCEQAKEVMISNIVAAMDVEDLSEGIDFHYIINRALFEHINVDLLRRCMKTIETCLVDAKMDKNKVDDIVLVGGSTRIPCVRRLVQDFFNGKEPCNWINADEAVAYGATLQAAILTGHKLENVEIRAHSKLLGRQTLYTKQSHLLDDLRRHPQHHSRHPQLPCAVPHDRRLVLGISSAGGLFLNTDQLHHHQAHRRELSLLEGSGRPSRRSHGLSGFVDGTFKCPAAEITVEIDGKEEKQLNPEAHLWDKQDQAILSAFVSSMTEGVVGMVLFAATSREAWETLAGAFASHSTARSTGIRAQMNDLKKGDLSVTSYFHQMKALSDTLTSIGQPLRSEEFISYVLSGLDGEFDALFEVINMRETPIPIRDLFSQLQATEHRNNARRAQASSMNYSAHAHVALFGRSAPTSAYHGNPPPSPFVPPQTRQAPSY